MMRGHEEATIDLMREEHRLRVALLAICEMPMSEQDNMLSANMRKIAAEALATFPDSVPLQHIPTEFN